MDRLLAAVPARVVPWISYGLGFLVWALALRALFGGGSSRKGGGNG